MNQIAIEWGWFGLSSLMVVGAGVSVGRLSGEIGERLGLGRAWSGAVLLSLATTLPELVTTVTAISRGALGLALGGILGSVLFNLFILVLVDVVEPEGRAIYHRISTNHLATGLLGCVLMGILLTGLTLGISFQGRNTQGAKSLMLIFPIALLMVYALGQYVLFRLAQGTALEEKAMKMPTAFDHFSSGALVMAYIIVAAIILYSGRGLALSAEKLAVHYHWGATFAGATLLGIVTSLPEITNALACARQKEFDLAVGNILGANTMVLIVLALAGLLLKGPGFMGKIAVPEALSAVAMTSLGIVMQGTVLGALAVRSDHRVWRVGIASVLLAGMYALSLLVSYQFSSQ